MSETEFKIFEFENKKYRVYRDPYEPNKLFEIRGKFIAKLKPITKEEVNTALKYSRIYVNVKYKGCEYTDDIMNNLSKLLVK